VNVPLLIAGSFRPKFTHCPAAGIGIVDDKLPAPPNSEHAEISTIKDKLGASGAWKYHVMVGYTSVGAGSSIIGPH
jgi:hypothetical protein